MALEHGAESLELDAVAEALGERIDQPDLFGEEGPDVGRRHLAGVVDPQRAHDLALHDDVRLEQPRRLDEVGRGEGALAVNDAGLTCIDVLERGRDEGEDLREDGVQLAVGLVENLLHLVDAVELLDPLLQRMQDSLAGASGIAHGAERLLDRSFRRRGCRAARW